MKTITIRELHQETGRWGRSAALGEVQVTGRGRLIAKIVPAKLLPCGLYVFFCQIAYW
jgi:antitoxin (DNA-binding transcriptional repressor) of toxin-antitoxin stability system